MSLDAYDLDLFQEFREIVSEVASARLLLVKNETPENQNPYELPETIYIVHFDGPAFSVKQLSAEQARYEFGATDVSYYKCTLATPDPPVALEQGWYAHIDFSRGLQVIEGTVERIEYKLSSLIEIFVNTGANVPFSFDEVL